MGLGIQSIFPPGREILMNFDWTEVLEGNSYITFYGALLYGKTTKYEYMETARSATKTMDPATEWTAQTFTVGTLGTDEDFYPTKIWVDNLNHATGVIEIQETTAGVPNGTVLAQFRGNGTTISVAGSNPEWAEFTISRRISKNYKLSAGTMYALVLYSGTAGMVVGFKAAAGYAGGSKYDSVNSGTDWTIDTGNDILFVIKGSTKNPYTLSTKASGTAATSTMYGLLGEDPAQLVELGDISFEGKVNLTSTIKGDAIVDYTFASNDVGDYYAVIELYHVRGVTETKIGEAETVINATSGSVEMELTQTTIKRGDIIKLKFNAYYSETSVTLTSYVSLAHNSTGLALHLPFKVDI